MSDTTVPIILPKYGMTMTDAFIVRWLKETGEPLTAGEVVVEIETDKAVMELEAPVSGNLVEIRVQPGSEVPVGTVLGVIEPVHEC